MNCFVLRVDGVLCPGSGLLSLLGLVGAAPAHLEPCPGLGDTACLGAGRVATVAAVL